jgi:23S rRNA (cytosine1962-C5)-methyltransferase
VEEYLAFANRLRKMARHFDKWARRAGIHCYRIYDGDLAGFPFSIERYEDQVSIAEYRSHRAVEEEDYRRWRSHCRQIAGEVLDLPPQHIHYKQRAPQKGSAQYEKQGNSGHELEVREGGLRFMVNLHDYLDTGLFLDHRITRALVRQDAADRRVLNLFAYTGSFSVYAAAGGARSTLSLDLSNTYLDWAQRNMSLNGFGDEAHRFERADVLQWLREKPRGAYDLIILDPPTFSNSKMMYNILDVQRDHSWLIERCLLRLAPGGLLYFSTNHRRFRMDMGAIPAWATVQDITARTTPPDFRLRPPHQCFIIQGSG